MKRIKKLASLLLALVMVFAMSATAFAAELSDDLQPPATEETGGSTADDNQDDVSTSQITISSGTYNIYQVFTGDYSEGILSNVKWGQNGTGTVGEKVDSAILEELEAVYKEADNAENNFEIDDVAQLNVIKKYANLTNPIQSGNETTYTGLAAGYYLVGGTVTYSNGQTAETLYVVRVIDGTLTFAPKVGVPTVDKKIVEDDERVDTNEASIGDVINYEITGTMPSNIDVYGTYTYLFTDTLSKGLTFNNDIKVEVDGVDVTDYFYKDATERNTTTGTTITVGIQDIKALKNISGGPTITAASQVIVTYSATLNTDAVIAGDGNPNDVLLNYSNNPNNSGEGTTTPPPENPEEPTHPAGVTPKKEVVTYTTELAILKTDETGAILEGAEFTLTGNGVKVSLVKEERFESAENGAYWKLKNGSYTTIAPVTEPGDTNNEEDYDLEAGKFNLVRTIVTATDPTQAVATIDADGRVTFTGLGKGTYTISETKTPAGYNTIEDITFTVDFNPATKTFSADNVSLGVNNTLETTIVNQKGSLLPSTGGIGTTIFYVVGGVLVIGAGILLVTKRRMNAH